MLEHNTIFTGWWFGTFSHILGIITPSDSFFRGVEPPTSYGLDEILLILPSGK